MIGVSDEVAPRRPGALSAALSLVFVVAAAAIFIVGDEWDSAPGALFLVWLGVHLAYGAIVASFWALPVALLVPLAIAPTPWDGYDTELWMQAAFAEIFYGIPFVFIGVIGRRLWQIHRPAGLPPAAPREEASP
jgi:hypothetical protein